MYFDHSFKKKCAVFDLPHDRWTRCLRSVRGGLIRIDEWNQFRELLGQPVIATGGKGPTGYMPSYPWKSAINLLYKNPKCKAGARHIPQTVTFKGIERKEEI